MKLLTLKRTTSLSSTLESNQIDEMEINVSQESIVGLKRRDGRIPKVEKMFKGRLKSTKVAKENQLQLK